MASEAPLERKYSRYGAYFLRLMRLLIGLLISVTIWGCSRTRTTETSFEPVIFDDTTSTDNLKPIDKGLLRKWKYDSEYSGYRNYYDYLDLKGKFRPKVIKITGDDYSALVLLTFDGEGNKIDEYEIAGGDCGGPTELEDKIEFCPYLKSTMVSDTEFIVREIREFTTDTINWVTTERDSTEWRILIDDNGKIKKKG